MVLLSPIPQLPFNHQIDLTLAKEPKNPTHPTLPLYLPLQFSLEAFINAHAAQKPLNPETSHIPEKVFNKKGRLPVILEFQFDEFFEADLLAGEVFLGRDELLLGGLGVGGQHCLFASRVGGVRVGKDVGDW